MTTDATDPTTLSANAAASRPLRRDAARNRERILAAAADLFAERGLGVTLNDVAHHAGVGVATVYRHFPDKSELIERLFQDRVEQLVAIGEAGLADPDPWHGLVTTMQQVLEQQTRDRGLHELIHDSPHGADRVIHVRSRMLPIGAELVRRAQLAGDVRADVDPTDLALVQMMIGIVIDSSRDLQVDPWRRCLLIALRGIATRPDALELQTSPPLSPEQVDEVMSRYKAIRG